MKTLVKIIGITVGLLSLNLISNSQDKYFSKVENQKYYQTHVLMDITGDSIPDIILAKYDTNQNKKIDTYALFPITKRDSDNYYTSDKAMAVAVDKDEDGVEDLYLLDTDLDGTLDEIIEGKEFKKEDGIKI